MRLTSVLLQVILCQFDALKYVRLVLARGKVRVPDDVKLDIEHGFRALMGARHNRAFEFEYWRLALHARSKASHVLASLDKNRISCKEMWASCYRRRHVTASNTTTSRVESNQSYLKRTLGRKTRIDRCVTAIWRSTPS
ncbi:hypothetical protein PybrP1_009114 [[Pythium] brassicae (nom. inval.)]|nr:hypothetical protein PybrP1_009114 [[Pythium] brassicae (nom. inval.)]